MKHVLVIILAVFSLSSFAAIKPASLSDIVDALKQSNASTVSNYFDSYKRSARKPSEPKPQY